MNKTLRAWAEDIAYISIGAALYAVGVNVFISPNDIAPGGVTGVAVVLNSLVPVSVGALYAMLNIPMIIAGFVWLNKRVMLKTLLAVTLVSVMTAAGERLRRYSADFL